MEHLQELLQKYWSGTATAADMQALYNLLSTDEEGLKRMMEKEYIQDLDKNTRIIDQLDSQELFAKIRQRTIAIDLKPQAVDHDTKKTVGRLVSMPTRAVKWFAAACFIFTLTAAGIYLLQKKNDNMSFAETATIKRDLFSFRNIADSVVKKTLDDGSIVSLAPQAAFSCYQPFDPDKRQISLSGKAAFIVAKDPTRPFTVFSHEISTTALGTVFEVDDENPEQINVKLLEGKVVIRHSGKKFQLKDIYLNPGEQLSVNRQNGLYTLNRFSLEKNGFKNENRKNIAAENVLFFNKAPLTTAFDKIAKRYKVAIHYDAEQLESLSFTGTFLPGDSLQTVLQVICNTNDLNFKNEKGVILITR